MSNKSQLFQRYNLQHPKLKDKDMYEDLGESAYEEEEDKENEEGNYGVNSPGYLKKLSQYGEVLPELYKESALNEKVDPISGVVPKHYASIGKSKS